MRDIIKQFVKYEDTYGIISSAHYLAAERNAVFNRALGIPVIVFTAIVGTTIFSNLGEGPKADPFWQIVTGLITLLCTILSSLQTALGFAQKAEKHKSAAESYRGIKRQFRLLALKYADAAHDRRESALSELEQIMNNLTEMAREYPTLPDRCFQQARRQRESQRAFEGETHGHGPKSEK